MTDLEFLASNPDVVFRLRAAFEGEAPEGSTIAVRRTDDEIQRRIAPSDFQPTSNERLAKWAFEASETDMAAVSIGVNNAF